jgi:hypothetical protein
VEGLEREVERDKWKVKSKFGVSEPTFHFLLFTFIFTESIVSLSAVGLRAKRAGETGFVGWRAITATARSDEAAHLSHARRS